jgi:hypothetical protein
VDSEETGACLSTLTSPVTHTHGNPHAHTRDAGITAKGARNKILKSIEALKLRNDQAEQVRAGPFFRPGHGGHVMHGRGR